MLGWKEEPYPGRALISFRCDYDNENLYIFLRFSTIAGISILLILAIIKI